MNIPIITKWRQGRAYKKHVESLAKHVVDVRAMQHYLPQSPEIIPYPQNSNALRSMAYKVPILRTCQDVINKQTWRRLPELKPKWEAKCPRCGSEYQEYKELCDNPECAILATRTKKPDVSQKQVYYDWEDFANRNKQNLWELFRQFTEEVHLTDNPWITVSYDYLLDELTGEIIAKKPTEFNFAKSEVMRLIQDNYGRPGGLYFTCVNHRDIMYGAEDRFKPCSHCQAPLHEVTAISVKYNQPATQSIREMVDKLYIEGEWFHSPYYTETTGYGISPEYTLWVLASSLWYMDENLQNTYKLGRPPKSLLIFNSYNPESITGQVNKEFKNTQNNRNYLPKIAMPWQGKTPAMVLNLMPNDAEIQTLDHKKDIRERMSALYGTSPLLMADSSIGGGLNNEGMQITVTLLRLETIHQWLEYGLFRFFFSCIGVTDWVLTFPPLKEEDRMAVQQRKTENMKMIGEAVDRNADYRIINDEDLEFEIIGHMTKIDQVDMGAGYQDFGGNDWNPRDWMKRDGTFAFSRMTKSMNPRVQKAVEEFLRDVVEIITLPETQPYLSIAIEALKAELKAGMRDDLVGQMVAGMKDAGLDLDDIIIDPDTLSGILDSIQFDQAVDGIELQVQNLMIDFDTKQTGQEMMDSLMEIGATVSNMVGDIQRTEANNLANLGREAAYSYMDPDDDSYDYYWVGPDYTNGRSTKACLAIKVEFEKERKKEGRVTRERARQIVKEEGCKEHGDEKAFCLGRDWTPHYNCRHQLVARSVYGKSMVESPGRPGTVGKGIRYIKDLSEVGESSEEVEDMEEGEGTESGSASDQVYHAVGVKSEEGVWEIKFFDENQRNEIEEELRQNGYELQGEHWVLMTEAEASG